MRTRFRCCAKPAKEGLHWGPEAKAFIRSEVPGHGEFLDLVVTWGIEVCFMGKPSHWGSGRGCRAARTRSGFGHGFGGSGIFVRGEVVEDGHGASLQFRYTHLLDVSGRDLPATAPLMIHGAINAPALRPATKVCVPHDPKGAFTTGRSPRRDRPVGGSDWL